MSTPDLPWFETAFGAEYKAIYEDTDARAPGEVEQILRYLSLPTNKAPFPVPRLLDLACGWGRHAIPLARLGYDVTGVEFSPLMLEIAFDNAVREGVRVSMVGKQEYSGKRGGVLRRQQTGNLVLVNADMRDLTLEPEVLTPFHYALSLFTSFGYFDTEDENLRVLLEINRVLAPGGSLLLDVDNGIAFRERVPLTQRITVHLNGDSLKEERVEKQERLDASRSRRVVDYLFTERPNSPAIHLECQLYDNKSITQLLARGGFEAVSFWGDLMGNEFSPASSRLVVLAIKRQDVD